MSSTDAWHIALAVFLVLTGVTLAYVFFRLSKLLGDVETHLDETMVEVVPKLGKITDSAVGAVGTVDHAARAASSAAAKPAKVVSGLSEGVEHAFQSLKSKRRQRGGVV